MYIMWCSEAMASRQLLRILRRGYCAAKSDPYKILGLTQGATRQDVKRAFYKLAKIFHPDIDPSKTAHFIEINRAYQELRTKAPFPRIPASVPKTEKIELELTHAEAMQGCRKKVTTPVFRSLWLVAHSMSNCSIFNYINRTVPRVSSPGLLYRDRTSCILHLQFEFYISKFSRRLSLSICSTNYKQTVQYPHVVSAVRF